MSNDRNRAGVIERLGGKCRKCGEEDSQVLQICHLVPVRRKTRTSTDSGGGLISRIYRLPADELMASYELLCANDHMRQTFDNKEWSSRID